MTVKPVVLVYGSDDERKIGECDLGGDHADGNVWNTISVLLCDHAVERFASEFVVGEDCNNFGQQRAKCFDRLADEIGQDAVNLVAADELSDRFEIRAATNL